MAGKTQQECIDNFYHVVARAHSELCQRRLSDNQASPQTDISQAGTTSTLSADSEVRVDARGKTRTMPTISASIA